MGHDLKTRAGAARALALVGIVALGIVSLVGSGGGGLGFPPCDAPWCNTPPSPPLPTVAVRPDHVTALVGTAVTFTAETANFSGTLAYQWRRSDDGGNTWVEIVGATGGSLTLPAVNLADDGALLRVTVQQNGGTSWGANGQLVVSATPGVVFADGQFQPADWTVSDAVGPNPIRPAHSEVTLTAGGNPGAFRKMVFTVGQGTGSGYVIYLAASAVYEPRQQGGIHVVDYREDCIALPGAELSYTEPRLVIEQAGRSYVADTYSATGICDQPVWRTVADRASLVASDFVLFDGPACGAGEACPDFSASAPPLRFGHLRIAYASPGAAVAHGIDNWRVTVWRR